MVSHGSTSKGALPPVKVVVRARETLLLASSNMEHSTEALEGTDDLDAFYPIRADWLDGSVETSPC